MSVREPFRLPIPTDDAPVVKGTGHEIRRGRDGTTVVRFDRIERIAINNVLTLRSHAISRVDGRTMHLIEFLDGGSGEITFTAQGVLEVFQVDRVNVAISADGRTVTLGCPADAAFHDQTIPSG